MNEKSTMTEAMPISPPPHATPNDAQPPTNSATDLHQRVEAALLSVDHALTTEKLTDLMGGTEAKSIKEAIEQLNQAYEQTGRSFRIEPVAGGWQIMTLPEFADILAAIHKTKIVTRLTPAAMETLAIIAYRQPILRVDVESIRGVACGEMIRSLMDRRLVKIVGRAEILGRPMLYGTTRNFLQVFGLASLKDLPKIDELKPVATNQESDSSPDLRSKPI